MLLKERRGASLTHISAQVIYGIIVLDAVIGSLRDPLPGNLRIIITVFLTLQVISWAKAYAKSISEGSQFFRLTLWRDWLKILLLPNWMTSCTAVPITFFGLSMLGVVPQKTALTATRAALLLLLLLFGFVAHRRRGGNVLQSVLSGIMVMLLGYVVMQIKLWTKYLPSIGL